MIAKPKITENLIGNKAVAACLQPPVRSLGKLCQCGHKRFAHRGANNSNDGGNDCTRLRCDCPVFIEVDCL